MDKFLYLISEGFKNVWRHKMTTFTAVFSLFLSLYFVGLLAIAGDNTKSILEYLRSKYKFEVFFKQNIEFEKAKVISQSILNIKGVRSSTIINKDDAVRIFKDQFDEDIISILGYNPLPISAVVNLKRKSNNMLHELEFTLYIYRNNKNTIPFKVNSDKVAGFNSFLLFYKEIIKFAIKNNNCALIIKPKKYNPISYFNKESSIIKGYNKLANEKRILVLNPNDSISSAAYFSDITISYGISTAGCISILLNKPNIFLNTNGNKFHPLKFIEPWNNLIIDSVEEISSKLKYVLINNKIEKSMKNLIDFYNDGFGNSRSGKFIYNFMEAMDKGKDRESSLQYALDSYKEKWGNAAIMSKISNNNEGLIIWEKSLSNIDSYFSGSK